MRQTEIIMGMPVTVEVVDPDITKKELTEIFDYFKYVDQKFSTYQKDSEISKFNRGEIKEKDFSSDLKLIFKLAEKTKQETNGFFNIFLNSQCDPSGIVKGWAIFEAAKLLKKMGFKNFYIDAGSDIQAFGKNVHGDLWRVGIKNPFNQSEIVKVLKINNEGVATSGNYIRGDHIYDPVNHHLIDDIVSLTVVGSNIYEADRFATAVYAMGRGGINFLEGLNGLEGYMIDKAGIATYTSGFERFVV
jgi:FAD:protein FMN transferase